MFLKIDILFPGTLDCLWQALELSLLDTHQIGAKCEYSLNCCRLHKMFCNDSRGLFAGMLKVLSNVPKQPYGENLCVRYASFKYKL